MNLVGSFLHDQIGLSEKGTVKLEFKFITLQLSKQKD